MMGSGGIDHDSAGGGVIKIQANYFNHYGEISSISKSTGAGGSISIILIHVLYFLLLVLTYGFIVMNIMVMEGTM